MPTLWHGRFDSAPDDAVRKLSDSLGFDVRMYAEDIEGSRAHVRMLNVAGLLSNDELTAILNALDTVENEFESGGFEPSPDDEDIHTAVERRVTELTPAGAKIHTGRSRNDQVATDLRLWAKSAIDATLEMIVALQNTLLSRAVENLHVLLPGYTHLQRAQPVTLGHHLLAHGWALTRDFERLVDARGRMDVSPLGAGALAGSTLPIDPKATAIDLGFKAPFDNSLDAVSDRDFVAETLFALGMLGIHISRIGEEMVLWSSAEFGFASIDDAYATGSSMMPQKANPDVAEMARGRAGRLIGNLTGVLATLKGLPLAYNKDLQEDKEPLFDSFDTIHAVLPAVTGMISTTVFNTDRMEEAASEPYLRATDLAEWLVSAGTPFREAHAIVAELVVQAAGGDKPFVDLVTESPDLGPEAARILDLSSRSGTRGGGTPGAMGDQVSAFKAKLAEQMK